jgi:diphthamide biosynthesis protein 3
MSSVCGTPTLRHYHDDPTRWSSTGPAPLQFDIMSIYEEVEIEDMIFDKDELVYTYPCPCGDKFRITLEELWDGEDVAKCPSCTLRIQVIYEESDLPPLPDDEEDGEQEDEGDVLEKFQAISIQSEA